MPLWRSNYWDQLMRKHHLAVIAVIAMSGAAFAFEKAHVKKGGAWVCRDIRHIERSAQYGDDDEAFVKFMLPKATTGECRALVTGTEIMIEDRKYTSVQALCVRPKGSPDCYWMESKFVER